MKKILICLLVTHQIAFSQSFISHTPNGAFPLVDGEATPVYCDTDDYEVVNIATQLLSEDIKRVSNKLPKIVHSLSNRDKHLVIIGTIGKSELIDKLVGSGKLDVQKILDQWEAHSIQVVNQPFNGIEKALVIVGNDRRGTAYGVFELSEQIGVSPWYWWADVPVKKSENFLYKMVTIPLNHLLSY